MHKSDVTSSFSKSRKLAWTDDNKIIGMPGTSRSFLVASVVSIGCHFVDNSEEVRVAQTCETEGEEIDSAAVMKFPTREDGVERQNKYEKSPYAGFPYKWCGFLVKRSWKIGNHRSYQLQLVLMCTMQ